ncbi:MAG: hypothetical protein Ct9H300mP32_0850 [Verrucomicrobiota bacterium]|nr:MAG: hypothetical protein Ct9H300mP32_0850 [Verrucomicrobiota bacterium]
MLPSRPRAGEHRSLAVAGLSDPSGTKQPVKPRDWASDGGKSSTACRRHGTLPDRANLPTPDMRVHSQAEARLHALSIDFAPRKKTGSRPALSPQDCALAKRPAILACTHFAAGKHRSQKGRRPNRAYAYELARRGYVVMRPTTPVRRLAYDFESDDYVSGTMKGIFNHMRCVDLLQSLPEVDPGRIGAIGHSLGGHNAMFVGVFDPRIKVIVSSCGWTPFHNYYGGNIKGWTSDRYMPLLKTRYKLDPNRVPFDFYEVVAALAPRSFFSSSPLRDSNFDVRGVKKAIPKAREIYKLLGQVDALQLRTPDCDTTSPLMSATKPTLHRPSPWPNGELKSREVG